MAVHARTHALNRLSGRTIALPMEHPPASGPPRPCHLRPPLFRHNANATLMLAQASTPTAATIAKSAMQTYIDGIRDLAELVV